MIRRSARRWGGLVLSGLVLAVLAALPPSALTVYLLVVVHIGAIPATTFALAYHRSPWRSTAPGRALMFKGRAIALLFDVAVIGYWWPFRGYAVLYAGVVTLVVIGVFYQCVVMLRRQHDGRNVRTPDGQF